ncbi:tetratricopeptide repeat protein [Neobacillus niacini]|uniref:tetratricopeptide repeat protein n=1 Tax=Neobacillus niacini TaxID=86668 RepID=UPI002FFEDCE4
MIEGKIIKFYREKAGLTQGQLVKGICSVTHLSKIERGITEYSEEITQLLAKKLNINPQVEITRYHNLSKKLERWHDAMIMQNLQKSEALKNELEQDELIQLQEFNVYYQLLNVRYYLSKHQLAQAHGIIQYLQKAETTLSSHDGNMLKHVRGIYYFLSGQFQECVDVLISIDQQQYNRLEYFYHLAIAYHSINSPVRAYYYADKALRYFRKTLNMLRIIDTEMVMLIQLNSNEPHDFNETIDTYEKLLQMCDTCNAVERKSKLYHNLAFEYSRRKQYQEAADLYQEALKLIDEHSPHYLTTLDRYIFSCYAGNLLSKELLIEKAQKGMKIAQAAKSKEWIYFQLHLYLLNQEEENYYQFIEHTALLFFKKMGYIILIDHYEKKLFHYLYEKGEVEKALELANSLIQTKHNPYDHD